ncbi:cobalamin-binding protein [Shewanella sp. cp20]|uniref:cobalamin-binding protein n=1 Tax=Shewanella sp. cp20 TaxID=1521167 RepID=UPI0005A1F9A4|nr:cobalamin-binding protein [Shewanella sp. cp20]KIO38195.1 ABC transporter substrate-binding protein [Shewanella sp. cp20]
MKIRVKLWLMLALLLCVPGLMAAPAKRIIALSPHGVEMLFSIGAGDRVVATTDHADFPDAAKAIPRIGGYYGVQIERVIELDPDLIVIWGGGNKREDIERLSQLGYPIYDSDPKTLEAVAEDLLALGKLTGKEVEAQRVAEQYLIGLKTLREEYRAKAPVSVFYQLWSVPLMTVSKGSWIEQIIEVCHGENVFIDAGNEYPQVSLEAVLLKRPQVILQSQDEGNVRGIDWSAWQEIPAVKQHNIYQLDADLLHRATPRAILGVESLCQALDRAR